MQSFANTSLRPLPSATLNDVLTWCVERRHVDRLLVATRLDCDATQPVLLVPAVEESVARIFGRHVLHETLASKWAGTQIIGYSGKVYLIEFNTEVHERMVALENKWSAWMDLHNPPLPEDLCLFRQGDSMPVLVSVTHDGDAWILDDGPVPRALASEATIRVPDDLLPPPPFYGD